MPRYQLVRRDCGLDVPLCDIGENAVTIGRAPDCGVVLQGAEVSRLHARVFVDGEELRIEDAGARNGVFVNGSRVQRSELRPGDEVGIGEHVLHVAMAAESLCLSDTTTYITADQARALYETMVAEEDARLPVLYRAAQLLGEVFEPHALLGRLLDLVLDALPAGRGFVLTVDPDSGAVAVEAASPEGGEGPPLSRTLVRHVVTNRDAVLTSNAMEDARFDAAQSIVRHGIRAAMCVPLCGREGVAGTLYVDGGGGNVAFTQGQLEILTAIGRVAGVAVENARLHAALLQKERLAAIGEASAGIGHCIKNLLVGFRGGEEFMKKALDRRDWTWVERGWPMAARSMARVENLVLNLLAYARETELAPEPVSIAALVEDVFGLVEERADAARVELCNHTLPLPEVAVDPREFHRVLLNLVGNAVDACEKDGGTVTVAGEAAAEGWTLEVRDTGPGVDPAIAARLFDAFATTKGSRGTGLGLACCRRIVEAHGGTIDAAGEPGQGAVFRIQMPHAPAARLQSGPPVGDNRRLPSESNGGTMPPERGRDGE